MPWCLNGSSASDASSIGGKLGILDRDEPCFSGGCGDEEVLYGGMGFKGIVLG